MCVITGANAGIGRATALELAGRGFDLILLGRSEERTRPVLEAIEASSRNATFIRCDLTSLASVAGAARSITNPIDVLINNAGVGGRRGITEDGFELAFGVNHLAHFLLTRVLLDQIHGRVVTVSSNAHFNATELPLNSIRHKTRSLIGWKEYGQSKLANVLFNRELAGRVDPRTVTTYAVHPGMTSTGIWRMPPRLRNLIFRNLKTPEEGAETSVWCATDTGLADDTGGYYAGCKPARISDLAQDEKLAAELWDRSEEWVAPFL